MTDQNTRTDAEVPGDAASMAQEQPAASSATTTCIPPVPPVPQKPKKQGQRLWPTFLVGIVAAVAGIAIGAAVVWGVASNATGISDSSSSDSSTQTSASSTTINVTEDTSNLAEAVSEKCLPSVVTVTTTYATTSNSFFGSSESTTSTGSGSGVIITEDGYILTNYHVIEDAESIDITLDGTDYTASVVGSDESSDIAVIKIDATGLTPMDIGSSSDLKVGEWVATIGSPFGYEKSVATGVVSALYRSTSLSSQTGITIYSNLIQTDASINPGNSGGALVNENGQLVGITTLYSSSTSSSANVGFAIPIDYAYRVATQIMNGEQVTHAYLGCSLASVTSSNAERYGLSVDSGAYVASVTSGTAADKAGLKEGDIITKADGDTISDAASLIVAIRSHDPGETMELTYVRDGSENTVTVTLGSDAEADMES